MRGNVVRQMNMLRREKPQAPADPTTKTCAYCALEIPIKATRCPQCTSQLDAA